MTDFVSSCLCRGSRPKQIGLARIFSRPDLISRLMRERAVMRCLVAPTGFGKTMLAAEYAQVVFSFEHVFWVDAKSPCFLRDLDNETLGDALISRDPACALVIFDELGCLDSVRAERFSALVDMLLARSCEVVATMVPSADAYANLQTDRMVLRAQDLMLSSAELHAHEQPSRIRTASVHSASLMQKIPLIAWGNQDCYFELIDAFAKERLPADMQLGVFCLLALQEGAFADLKQLEISLSDAAFAYLKENYPYCGIDIESETFSTLVVPLKDLLGAFLPKIEKRAVKAGFSGRDDFAQRACSLLVARGKAQRACEMATAMLTSPARAKWLSQVGLALFNELSLVSAGEVYMSIRRSRSALDAKLQTAQAWRLAMLGDIPEALAITKRVQVAAYAQTDARAFSALLCARFGMSDEQKKAYEVLDELDGLRSELVLQDDMFSLTTKSEENVLLWLPLVQIQRALATDVMQAVLLWEKWSENGAHAFAQMLAGAWIAWAMKDKTPRGILLNMQAAIDKQQAEEDRVGLIALIAEQAYRSACEKGAQVPQLSIQTQTALLRAKERLQEQKTRYRKNIEEIEAPILASTAQANLRRAVMLEARQKEEDLIPPLYVYLFGRFDIRIGEQCIEESSFSRQKTKTLLALLALSAGREVPRDKLAASLWRCSSLTSARKNLYTVWSALRRNLELNTGTCPYLIRLQNGFKLDKRFLQSDVNHVDAFCKSVIMGEITEHTWAPMLSQINEAYAGDLMPSETENDEVMQMRLAYRSQVVGALITASAQLVALREPRGALCYADAAFAHDSAREDVYVARMRAQIACNQRTQALETYFACRKFLAEELGIDPSAELVELYRSIIEEEAVLY